MRRFVKGSKQALENMMNSRTGQETDMKVILPCLKVFWFCKDNGTEHNDREKNKK